MNRMLRARAATANATAIRVTARRSRPCPESTRSDAGMSWPLYSPAERLQHRGEMGIRPEQAGLDAAELALLAIAEAHRRLLTCGLRRDAAPRIASRLRRPPLGRGPARSWPGGDQGAGPGGGSRARTGAVSGRPGARWLGPPAPAPRGIRPTECWTSTSGQRWRTSRPG